MKKSKSENLVKSSVLFVSFPSKRRNIIVSTQSAFLYHVISIDPYHGCLSYSGVYGKDVFSSEEDALNSIANGEVPDVKVYGHSLLGYTTSGKNGILLIVKSIEPEYKLMKNHTIYKIKETECIKFDILYQTKYEINYEKLKNYPFNNNHYACQTYDISKPFGNNVESIPAVNAALSISLTNLNIPFVCPHVIQGVFSVTRIEEIMSDVIFISRKVFSNTQLSKGVDKCGRPALEYQCEFAFILSIGSRFEVVSHIIHIGDYPLQLENEYADEELDKKIAKITLEKVSKFVGNSNITNIIFNNKNNPEQQSLSSRAHEACNFSNENISSDVIECEWSNSVNKEFISYVEKFWVTAEDKMKNYGFTRMIIDENTTIIKELQKGFIRASSVQFLDDELSALFFYLLKLVYCCGCMKFNVVEYADITRISINYMQHVANFIIRTASSIEEFSSSSAPNIKKFLLQHVPDIVNIVPKQTFAAVQDSIEAMNFLYPENSICASYGPNAFIVSPQSLDNRILCWGTTPFNISVDEGDVKVILSHAVYAEEVILELSCTAPYMPPSSVSIYGGLYLNRMFPIKENVSIPYTKEKHFSVCIPFVQENNYDTSCRLCDVDKVKYISLDFKSAFQKMFSVCGIAVYGTNKEKMNLSLDVFKEINSKTDLTIKNRYINKSEIVPDAIRFETSRVIGMYSGEDAIRTLIQNGIHPDSYDLGLLQNIERLNNSPQKKKKKCQLCQERKSCTKCCFCKNFVCSDCMKVVEGKNLCVECAEQRKQLLDNIDSLKIMNINGNKEQNMHFKEHKVVLKRIGEHTKSSIEVDGIGSCPKAWLLYEQSKGLNDVPFEFVFMDNDTVYESSYRIIQSALALESFCEIDRIEVLTDYPLKIVINSPVEEEFVFNPPASAVDVSITTQLLDFTLIGNKIAIRRIKFFGKHITCEADPVKFTSPLKRTKEKVSTTYKYPHIVPTLAFSIKQIESNNTQVFSFDTPQTIVGFRFNEAWRKLKIIAFEIYTIKTASAIFYITTASKHNWKEGADLIFSRQLKNVKCIKIWYLRLTEHGMMHLSAPPFPLILQN